MLSRDAVRRRLASAGLAGRRARTPLAVVLRMGAMQAQDYGQALWAIGSRLPGSTVDDVTAAIESGQILRTWPMRGTIHFVPAHDAAWMVRLCASRVLDGDGRRLAQLDLDLATVRRSQALLQRALSGGRRLSRPAVLQLFEDGGISTKGQRGYHLLWHAAQAGLICLGPMEGKQQTFVLLDEWAPAAAALTGDDALAELARRYFTGHGPATAADFAWWTGLTLTRARTALAQISGELSVETADGVEYWSPGPRRRAASAGPLLLAGFDEYLLGYKDRSSVLPAAYVNRIVPGNNGVFSPILVLDGVIVGTWKRAFGRNWVDVTLTLFEDVGDALDGFAHEAERYAAFMRLPLRAVSVARPA